MSRVRGKHLSKSSSAPFARGSDEHLIVSRRSKNGVPSSFSEDLNHHGGAGRLSARHPEYVKRTRIPDGDKGINTRVRFSGLVGPEPDFSVRHSNVPIALWMNMSKMCPEWAKLLVKPSYHSAEKAYKLDHRGRKIHVGEYTRRYAETRPTKGCVRTIDWDDEMVGNWTKFAMTFGIEYQGKADYKIPRGICASINKYGQLQQTRWEADPKPFSRIDGYNIDKTLGLCTHRRSPLARMRRSARRASKDALIHPIKPDMVFVRRCPISAKNLRKRWFETTKTERISFAAFKQKYGSNPVLTLFPRGCRLGPPPIVFSALKRIYGNPKKFLPDKIWFVPKQQLSYAVRISSPPKDVLVPRQRVLHLSKHGSNLNSTIPRAKLEDIPEGFRSLHRENYLGNTIYYSDPILSW